MPTKAYALSLLSAASLSSDLHDLVEGSRARFDSEALSGGDSVSLFSATLAAGV